MKYTISKLCSTQFPLGLVFEVFFIGQNLPKLNLSPLMTAIAPQIFCFPHFFKPWLFICIAVTLPIGNIHDYVILKPLLWTKLSLIISIKLTHIYVALKLGWSCNLLSNNHSMTCHKWHALLYQEATKHPAKVYERTIPPVHSCHPSQWFFSLHALS